MPSLTIKEINKFSLAKVLTAYSFYVVIITLILDLIYFVFSKTSWIYATNSFTTWITASLIRLILSPVAGFVIGFVFAIIINLALKTTKGLELEIE